MERKEFEELLEAVYEEGYNQAELDLMNESNNVKKEIDKHRDTSSAGEDQGIDGFSKYDPNKIKTQNKKWLSNADPHHTNMTMDGSNDFYFVHRNKGANGKSSTPRGRIKVGDDDLLKERENEKPKGSALKDHIKELKWLREQSILNENTFKKHPERRDINERAREADKIGLPRDKFYRLAHEKLKADKKYPNDDIAKEKIGMKEYVKLMKSLTPNQRINIRQKFIDIQK